MIAVLGGLVGTLLAAVMTDPIVSSVMKLAGISNFESHSNFISVILPMAVVTFFLLLLPGFLQGRLGKYRLQC